MDNTTIYFLSGIPLDNTYAHTFSWEDATTQYNYFVSKSIHSMTSSTYQRAGGEVRIDLGFDDINTCNYIMYRNSAQSSKWYYAFVTSITYQNDSMAILLSEVDVLQTYYFDYRFANSFIEREHVTSDKFGEHTLAEGLETGEYKVGQIYNDWFIKRGDDAPIAASFPPSQAVIIGANIDVDNSASRYPDIYASMQSNSFSGVKYYAYLFETSETVVGELLSNINIAGKIEGVKTLFMMPSWFVQRKDPNKGECDTSNITPLVKATLPSTIDGYTPKNNKLRCHPYNSIYITNNQGQYNELRYELFNTPGSPDNWLVTRAIVNESCKALLIPYNYSGKEYNYDNGISMPSWMQCSWSSDTFAAWFAQNGASWAVNTAASAGSLVAGLATGNLAGAAVGFWGVFNSTQQITSQQIAPPSTHGNSGSMSTLQGLNENWFSIYQRNITREMAIKIDNFFEMFGYKVNRVGIPARRSRPQWNYIKTIQCNLQATLNHETKQKIESIHNNGVTYWRSPDNIFNYFLNNHEGVAK